MKNHMKKTAPQIDLDGPAVAELLDLDGVGLMRYCPVCASDREDRPDPSLSIHAKGFRCAYCDINGDIVDLVRLVKKCDRQDALEYLLYAVGDLDPQKSVAEALAMDSMVDFSHAKLYRMFIEGCPRLPTALKSKLNAIGIATELIDDMQLRLAPEHPQRLLAAIKEEFGTDAILASGLMREALHDSVPGKDYDLRLEGAFEEYHRRKLPYVITPYIVRGQPVYLKARPLQNVDKLVEEGVRPYMSTHHLPPCPFLADALRVADRVVITRREMEAMMTTSLGYRSIALGTFGYKPDTHWFSDLADKQLVLVLNKESVADKRIAGILRGFHEHNRRRPKIVEWPHPKDLRPTLRQLVGEPDDLPLIEP